MYVTNEMIDMNQNRRTMKHVYLEDNSNFNIIKYFITCDRQCIPLTFIGNPIFRRQNVNLAEKRRRVKGILFTRMTDRERQGETGRDGEARVPVEYKDTQSSRKKGGGMQAETYRKDPPPLFHRNDVRHPPFSCHPCRLAVPLLEPLHLRLSLILCLSHPLA